ncbi:MAG: peptidyl-prolyl cis-trans isomerase [Planctomycetes bacterium]|nr:peptidyl-prolyl cis-trans isomerase [Planctomycetota bacterium]
MRTRTFVPVLFLCSSLLPAQERPEAPANPRPVLVDGVIATVNDSAILLSTVRGVAKGRLNELAALQGRLSPQQLEAEMKKALAAVIDRHSLAHAAKTFGKLTPDQVDQIVDQELERDQQQQVKDVGSINAYTRELKRLGRDWPTYADEQRIEKLYDLAEEFGVRQRLARQTNLYLTPRMLRETYQNNVDLFVRPALATVLQVQFTGSGAEAAATEASTVWRLQELTPRQLADKFTDRGATALAVMDASSLAVARSAIRDFALAGPAGAVSPPVQIGQTWVVARVGEFRAARNSSFDDPKTQDELRSLCSRKVIEEFRMQAMDRARQRTEVWSLIDQQQQAAPPPKNR